MSQSLSEQQEKRTAKALIGLANGFMTVTPAGTDTWRVKNGDQEPYLVVRTNDAWACACPDWAERCLHLGIRCKHIEAVRLAPPTSNQISHQKETHMSETSAICGWTKLFHPSGAQVTVPLPLGEPLTVGAAQSIFQSVNALLEAGWLVNMPGLEEGERVEEIRHVVRRVKINDDGTETPVVDLYPERANFRILGVYLNTPQDIQAFESACDAHLGDLPLYEGDNAIERGKGPKTDKYVFSLSRSARVVLKQNPRWEGEEDKKHPKRLFVRWLDSTATNGNSKTHPAMSVASQPSPGKEPASTDQAPGPRKNHSSNPDGDIDARLKAAREFIIPEGKTVKGKKLGDVDQKVLAYIANEYKPTTPDGEKCKEAARLILATIPAPTL